MNTNAASSCMNMLELCSSECSLCKEANNIRIFHTTLTKWGSARTSLVRVDLDVYVSLINYYFFFFEFTAHLGLGFYTLFVQYYSGICHPSDHTVGMPRAENRTWDWRSRGKDSNH